MFEEVDLQGHTVEVALVTNEVGLDLAGLLAEGGVRANGGGGGMGDFSAGRSPWRMTR